MRTKLLFVFMLLSIAAFGQQNPIQIDANGLTQTLTAGGLVVRGQIVKINSAGQVVPMLITDTSGAIGVAATSQTSQGNSVTVSLAGSPLVQIDASGCAAGNIVSFSTTTGGAGHCATTASGQQVGVALSISSPGSNFWNVQLSLGGGGVGIPNQFNVTTYGAIGNARSTADVVTANLSPTITSASNPWVAADVGKGIFCNQGGFSPVWATILTFNSAGSITLNSNATGAASSITCVWETRSATGDDTAAFQAACNAARGGQACLLNTPTVPAFLVPYANPDTFNPGTVYCPSGGYVVSGTLIGQFNNVSSNEKAVGFAGPDNMSCIIWMRPDGTYTNGIFSWQNVTGPSLHGVTINGANTAFAFALPLVAFQASSNVDVRNVRILYFGNTSHNTGVMQFNSINGGNSFVENVFIQNSPGTDIDVAFGCLTSTGISIKQSVFSNHNTNALFNNCGGRSSQGAQVSLDNVLVDECAATTGCTVIKTSSLINSNGGTYWNGGAGAISVTVDGTSAWYANDVNCSSFNSGLVGTCLSISSGGKVYANNSTLNGNTTGVAVTGPAGASFFDIGGNSFGSLNGSTLTPCTVATYSTCAFSGGIIPKATVTHTPNTCYAVTGNLLATAQNICTLLLDQNYQAVNIAAQSGGTTPASSSCATPPTITLSDGTRSETMTMTSGQTVWCSTTSGSCTASSVTNPNQVFASGALLTVSIGANTCATPPSNVSVNYVLQSVLNP